ncbi:hypothetical protein BLAT2472_70170 [Burkholderia latens]
MLASEACFVYREHIDEIRDPGRAGRFLCHGRSRQRGGTRVGACRAGRVDQDVSAA